ncbi:MAG TPA: SlyX family protein [Candidatus Ornithospirochaeta stercorigallinarum]|nr:SlyX family protein [Candidatus Ornithospirochaeta stercorigallinarum]
MQEELDALEIKVSYLELKCDELNDVIISQDRAISKMKAQIEALEKKVIDLEEEAGQDRPNRKPPHY